MSSPTPDPNLDVYLPRYLKVGGASTQPTGARVVRPHRNDLFADVERAVPDDHGLSAVGFAEFSVSPNVKIVVDTRAVVPAEVQSLIYAMRDAEARIGASPSRRNSTHEIDPSAGLSVITSDPKFVDAARDAWRAVRTLASVSDVEARSTPKLYGSKLRLTPLLAAAVCSNLPAGSPILDAMAGTGIVSRMLSGRFRVSVNDANAYAAVFARSQGATLTSDADELIERLRHVASRNFEALMCLAPTSFATEADFFHGDLSDERFGHYEQFCRQQVIMRSESLPGGAPYQLCLARYANSYFGVAQCAQLDSLRAAIDEVSPGATPERDLLLSALLMAASVCSTGPHFAQPRKLTMASFRDTVERRARSVIWEFELAVRRMAARPPLRHPIESASQWDWRKAVTHFARGLGERRPAAVYFDPPYSKFQYSRYYHLLNVLISYDYPSIHGIGRYPPLAERFSSRFEHNSNPALCEFEDAFNLCRDLGLRVFVSYSNRGLVAADVLIDTISRRFAEVVEFSDRIRHHSQGTRLGDHLGYVTEFVLAARND
jgi:adenine-specific DNA-methyltransferase